MSKRHGVMTARAADEGGGGGAGAPRLDDGAAANTVTGATVAPAPAETGAGGLSQEQVSAIAAREKAEGKRAGTKELLEKLGVASAAEAERLLNDAREREKANMTETERAKAEAEAELAAARAEREAVRVQHYLTEVRSALVSAGITEPQKQADLARLIEVPADLTEPAEVQGAIAEGVRTLQERYPALFGAQPQQAAGGVSHATTGGGKPPASQGGSSALERGAERARKQQEGRPAGRAAYNPNPFATN